MTRLRSRASIVAALLLGTLLPGVAPAQLPEGACYRTELDPAELAARPERGVQALSLEFLALTDWDRQAKGPWRHVRISARMAAQGQGLRDEAAGALLTATAECRSERLSCWTDGDAAHFTLRVHDAATLELRTRHFPVADYGGSMTESNLAESDTRDTVYLLARAEPGACALD